MNKLILMTIAYIGVLIVNTLATTGNINNQTTSEISNSQTVLFTPEGYVFSIWGVIYLLVAIWLFLQFKRKDTEAVSSVVSSLFIVSCILNILWLITWHYELFAISQVMMLLLLVTLIVLYKQYAIVDSRFGGRFPFSIYLGWISVATIANMSFTLKHYEISLGISEPVGTVILIIIAGLLAVAGCFFSKDPYFAIVFVWSIGGIAAANTDSLIVNTAYVVALIVLIAIPAISYIFNKNNAIR